MNILIAEDDAIARRVLSLFLAPYGSVHAAATGKEALSMFERALQSESSFDLVCLDIHMPGLEGLEVLKNIREIEVNQNPARKTPVLMLTGSSEEKEIAQAQLLGAKGFILKPIIESDLIDHLDAMGMSPKN
jgi:CheY-like chemotaxis protein